MESIIKTLATKDDLAKVNLDLSQKINDSVKWMFVFWVGQVGATLATIFLILKK